MAARDKVWGGYRFAVVADAKEPDGLKAIDLGAGHSSSNEPLCGRVIAALKSQALLSESVGAGYIERNWPPALKDSGAWPLSSLRQSFLNGSLTRLLDPDTVLRGKVVEFVAKGELGLASGAQPDGTYQRVWYKEIVAPEDVTFDAGVFLLTKAKAQALRAAPEAPTSPGAEPEAPPEPPPGPTAPPEAGAAKRTFRLVGRVPPEVWNRIGTRLVTKLRSGADLEIGVEFKVTVEGDRAGAFESDIRQILQDLGLADRIRLQ
jgi:hypothetical protein